jgi:hypothetical protein
MSRLWDTAAIRAEVARRRTSLLDGLADSGSVAVVEEGAEPPGSGPVDHLVSVAWLALQDDLDAAIAQLAGLIGDDGRLHLIEPTVGVDLVAQAQRRTATVAQRHTGWRVDRDVPAAARRAGLVLTDLERFSMPVPFPVLRPWIQGIARVRPEFPSSVRGGS